DARGRLGIMPPPRRSRRSNATSFRCTGSACASSSARPPLPAYGRRRPSSCPPPRTTPAAGWCCCVDDAAPGEVMRVCALYPDLMNIYADRGNLLLLERRCAWREIGFELCASGLGEVLDGDAHDLYYLGGGQDRDQR